MDAAYVMAVCTGLTQHLHPLLKGSHASRAWQNQNLERHLQHGI